MGVSATAVMILMCLRSIRKILHATARILPAKYNLIHTHSSKSCFLPPLGIPSHDVVSRFDGAHLPRPLIVRLFLPSSFIHASHVKVRIEEKALVHP